MSAKKNGIAFVLNEEIGVIEKILGYQAKVYACVKEKNWTSLEEDIEVINSLSLEFSRLDAERDNILSSGVELSADEKELLARLRSLVLKSKVEHQVLNTYIETMQKFVRGILDNVVPGRRNVLYSRDGKLVKQEPTSIVLNQVL